jgi:hypothetical protein
MKLIYKVAVIVGAFVTSAAVFGSCVPDSKTTSKAAAPKTTAPVVTEAHLRTAFINRCRGELKAQLNDPDSYRELGATGLRHEVGDGYSVGIHYSATNGFGGRVQDHHFCNYVKS